MKTFYKTILIAGFILISTFELQAQTTDNKLNQVDLMKKFVGRWKCELGKDTILISENVAFGTGLVCNSQVTANGKILNSVKQLYGYDKKTDKFIVAELIESAPVIEICSTWFTSATIGELVVTNPDNAPFRFKFEFKTPDSIEQTAIQNNKVVKVITITRITDEKLEKEVYKSEKLIINQISKSVYQHISFFETQDWGKVSCNGMIAVSKNEAIIFDTPPNNETSIELIEWITKSQKRKITAVIPTHYHIDNLGGLNEFHKQGIPSYACNKTIQITKELGLPEPQHSFDRFIELQVGSNKVYVEFLGEGHTRDNVILNSAIN